MSAVPQVSPAISADQDSLVPEATKAGHTGERHKLTRRSGLSHLVHLRGLDNIERQLVVVQWALPLVLVGIVLLYEVTEHFFLKEENFPSLDFLGEVVFFGILGPVAVWLVLRWIQIEWLERERDKRALQRMYDELATVQQRLNTLHAQRGELLNRLMSVQEEERRHLAREIHDELGQLLTGLSLNLKLCQEAVPENLQMARERLAKANALVRHTIEQSHRIISDLRPTVLDDYGLVPALQEELSQRLSPLGIDADLETEGDVERLPADVATAAFRIVQEAITNVIRHAHAQQVHVRLQQSNDGLTVSVEDDGAGFPGKDLDRLEGHHALGILGMQERARALGGRLTVTRREPRGTRVHLWLPLQRQELKEA